MGQKLGDTATDIGKGGKCGQITLVVINILFIVSEIVYNGETLASKRTYTHRPIV